MTNYGNGRPRFLATLSALALAMSLTGCSLLGGSSSDEQSSGAGALEKSTIKVSVMKATDLVPFHLARKKGYFADEGLTVKFVNAPSGADSANKVVSGEADIAFTSYTPMMTIESKGVLKNKGGLKIVADASSAAPGTNVVLATPSSSVKGVKDMAGKRVAVSATGTIAHLLVMSTMKTNGVPYDDVKWVATPFPTVAQALKTNRVDAAFAAEPFIQDAMKNAGARMVFDTAAGPTADVPIGGYISAGDFVEKNPKTVAAFQRAMQRATSLALSDRNQVNESLVTDIGVDKDTAKLANLATFQSKLEASRIQRVPDLMLEFGVIEKRLDVSKMIVPTSPRN